MSHIEVPINTSTMALNEKGGDDQISPISSHAPSPAPQETQSPAPGQPNTKDFNHPNLAALDDLQVLPKILREGILFVASGPALLLQAAKPSASQISNSNLTTELTTAFHATITYIACLVFGTREEKAALLGRIRLGQPPLLTSQGLTRQDADSQLWLVATLYATATDFYQRIYGTVDYPTAEAGFAEFSTVLRHLTPTVLAQGSWPSSRNQFWKYWDEQIEGLRVSDEAQRFAAELPSRVNELPGGIGYLKPLLRPVTIEMLPEKVREGYGLQSTAGTRTMYSSTIGLLKPCYPVLPKTWRSSPVKYYLEELRNQINA